MVPVVWPRIKQLHVVLSFIISLLQGHCKCIRSVKEMSRWMPNAKTSRQMSTCLHGEDRLDMVLYEQRRIYNHWQSCNTICLCWDYRDDISLVKKWFITFVSLFILPCFWNVDAARHRVMHDCGRLENQNCSWNAMSSLSSSWMSTFWFVAAFCIHFNVCFIHAIYLRAGEADCYQSAPGNLHCPTNDDFWAPAQGSISSFSWFIFAQKSCAL